MANDTDWRKNMEVTAVPSNTCDGILGCVGGKFNTKEAKCRECLAEGEAVMREYDEISANITILGGDTK